MQVVVSKYIFIIARYWVADLFNLSACLYIFYLLNFFHISRAILYITVFNLHVVYFHNSKVLERRWGKHIPFLR